MADRKPPTYPYGTTVSSARGPGGTTSSTTTSSLGSRYAALRGSTDQGGFIMVTQDELRRDGTLDYKLEQSSSTASQGTKRTKTTDTRAVSGFGPSTRRNNTFELWGNDDESE